jgi:hypothetical protein
MVELDLQRDSFVSLTRARVESGISTRKFQRLVESEGLLPVYEFPPADEDEPMIERFLRSDLRCAISGALQ